MKTKEKWRINHVSEHGRNSKGQTEYIVPDELEKIATNQYVANFSLLSIDDEEEKEEFSTSNLIGTENAEFTIFEDKTTKMLGEGLTIEI